MPAKKMRKDPTPKLETAETEKGNKKVIPAAEGKAPETPMASTSRVDPAPEDNIQVKRPAKPLKKRTIPEAEGKAPKTPMASTSRVDPVPEDNIQVKKPAKPLKEKAIPADKSKAPDTPVAAITKAEPVQRRTSPRYFKSKPVIVTYISFFSVGQ